MTRKTRGDGGTEGDRSERTRRGKGRERRRTVAGDDPALVEAVERLDHELRQMERRLESVVQDLSFDWSRLGAVQLGWTLVPSGQGTPALERFGSFANDSEGVAAGWRRPAMDHVVDDLRGLVTLRCELPGVKKEDVDVTIVGDAIEVRAENGPHRYDGQVVVDADLSADGADATYADGVLHVVVPLRREEQPPGRSVRVK